MGSTPGLLIISHPVHIQIRFTGFGAINRREVPKREFATAVQSIPSLKMVETPRRKSGDIFVFVVSILTMCSAAAAEQQSQRTNVVVFFADNLGWGDVWGAPSTRTPALDSLARDGMRLLNWNSAAHVCSPSRASLLTGRLMVRTGVSTCTSM